MTLVLSASDQAKNNQIKNRGDPGQWYQHKADFREPQPNPRVRPEAREIAEKNKPTVDEVVHNYRLESEPEKVAVRLRDPEAKGIADKFTYQDDKWFDFEGNQQYHAPAPPVKAYPPCNKELAQQLNQQQEHDWFDHTKMPPQEDHRYPHVTSAAGKEIAAQLGNSRKVDWFAHDKQHDLPPSRCGSRTRGDVANEYAERNRQGSTSDWMVHHNHDEGIVYGNRCPTSNAQINKQNARGQSMRDCFDYTTGYVEPPPPNRVKGEIAEDMYLKNTRGTSAAAGEDRNSFAKGPNLRPGEALEIAERNKGQMNRWMDQEQNRNYSSPRPNPRTRTSGAQEAAERNKGDMGSYLSKPEYCAGPPRERKVHERSTKSEMAKEMAERSKGGATKDLLSHSALPAEQAPKARITGYGGEYAERNKGTAGMVISGMVAPDRDGPAQRVRPEAAENAAKHRGGDFFKTIQQCPNSQRY